MSESVSSELERLFNEMYEHTKRSDEKHAAFRRAEAELEESERYKRMHLLAEERRRDHNTCLARMIRYCRNITT